MKNTTPKKKAPKKRSISVDNSVYNKIVKIKEIMQNDLHGRVTFNMAVQSILNDHSAPGRG